MTADEIEFDRWFHPPDEETLRKLELSKREAAGLVRREVMCPICGFRIMSAYTREGCVRVKCRRCKFDGPISLRWFRRQTSSFPSGRD